MQVVTIAAIGNSHIYITCNRTHNQTHAHLPKSVFARMHFAITTFEKITHCKPKQAGVITAFSSAKATLQREVSRPRNDSNRDTSNHQGYNCRYDPGGVAVMQISSLSNANPVLPYSLANLQAKLN